MDSRKQDQEPVPIKVDARAKYFTPRPKDKKDCLIGFKVTSSDRRRMDVAMMEARGKLPFETYTDFLYWCFVTGLRTVTADLKSERLTNLTEHAEAAREVLKDSEDRRSVHNLFTALDREVRACDEAGGDAQVPKILRKFEEQISHLPPGFWVHKYTEEFYDKYRRRLRADRVSNSPRNAVKDEE